jgi:hypothetical protein
MSETKVEDSDATGLLIIRAWVERGSTHPLRAQVRLTADVTAGFDGVITLCRPEDVSLAVDKWLADVTGAAEPGPA